jgi:hypothetical protein
VAIHELGVEEVLLEGLSPRERVSKREQYGTDLAQDDASRDVGGVSEECHMRPEEGEEQAVIVLTHALVEPDAVVVEDGDADPAE